MTPFKEKVWRACARIPRGRVSTYKEIARAIGKPRAARAVGNTLNKNRSKRVPCHRVVLSSGKLGGFAAGTRKKKKLLEREGIRFRGSKIKNFGKLLYKF